MFMLCHKGDAINSILYFKTQEMAEEYRNCLGSRGAGVNIEVIDIEAEDLWEVNIKNKWGRTRQVHVTSPGLISFIDLARLVGDPVTVESVEG